MSGVRNIGPPPAERGDLALAFTEERLPKDSEHLGAIREADFPDTEPGRLLEQDVHQSTPRNTPNLHGNGDSAVSIANPNHRRMTIPDGPEAVGAFGRRFPDEGCAHGEEIGVQFESAHQGSVDGQEDWGGRRYGVGVRHGGLGGVRLET